MKKILISSLLLLLIICICIIYISQIYISQTKFVNLFLTAQKPSNIHIHSTESSHSQYSNEILTCDYYYKDNIYVKKAISQNNSTFYTYKNFNNNTYIYIVNTQEYKEISIDDITSDNNNTFWDKYPIVDDTLKNTTYHYKGIESIDNTDTYKSIFKNKHDDTLTTFWINKNNGFIQKYLSINNNLDYSIEELYSYYPDSVNDSDIQEPNINDYKDYNIIYKNAKTTD